MLIAIKPNTEVFTVFFTNYVRTRSIAVIRVCRIFHIRTRIFIYLNLALYVAKAA